MTYTIFYQLPFTGTIGVKIPAYNIEQAIRRCRSLSTKEMIIISAFDENWNKVYSYDEKRC